jgi:hypothetical protein
MLVSGIGHRAHSMSPTDVHLKLMMQFAEEGRVRTHVKREPERPANPFLRIQRGRGGKKTGGAAGRRYNPHKPRARF